MTFVCLDCGKGFALPAAVCEKSRFKVPSSVQTREFSFYCCPFCKSKLLKRVEVKT